jgi:hypothetical protein
VIGAGSSLASDADRDAAAATLAEAVASGRLSLAGHRARLDQVYAAVTLAEVDTATSGLTPAPDDSRALVRILGPYRCLLAGGRAHRAGRFRVGRFCTILLLGGTLELDLRAAQLSQGEVTFSVYALGGRLAITVPPGTRVVSRVLGTGRGGIRDDDGATGSAAAPVIRLRGGGLASRVQVTPG